MKHIYSAVFIHESNTFSERPSDREWFKKRALLFGEETFTRHRGAKTEYGGFIDTVGAAEDAELIPVIDAEATPGGPVTADVFDLVCGTLCAALKAAPKVDAVLLSLHGAMVCETHEDGEGALAEAVRAVIGPDVPLYATLDLHANVSEKMGRLFDVLIPYDNYPHTDKYDRGCQAAGLLLEMLRGKIRPVMASVRLPLLFPLAGTASAPMRPVAEAVRRTEAIPGILNASLSHGFISADTAETGAAVQVIADADRALAEKAAGELAQAVWRAREGFGSHYVTPEEAARRAAAYAAVPHSRPLVISDGPDNPGGGSYADGTLLLKALRDAGCRSALMLTFSDPAAVEACEAAGEGAELSLSLGGHCAPAVMGAPLKVRARVLKLTNGEYRNFGPMNPGIVTRLQGTALIEFDGIRVIVSKYATQPYDLAVLALHGIDPLKEAVIAVKSAVHFRAAYEPVASEILDVAYPGICALTPGDLPLKKVRRPVWPLDRSASFAV